MIDRAMDDGFRVSEELEDELFLDDKCNRDNDSLEIEESAKGKLPPVKPSIFAKLLLVGRKGKGTSEEAQL